MPTIEDKLDRIIELLESISTRGVPTEVDTPPEEAPVDPPNEGDQFADATTVDASNLTKKAMEEHGVDRKIIAKLLKTYGANKASLLAPEQISGYMKELSDMIEDSGGDLV